MKKRAVKLKRRTTETDIKVDLNIDGTGKFRVYTGIGFLDHMLSLFARHGCFDLKIIAKGDLNVDIHHTNEDVGIALGEAMAKALGNKKGIRRFGSRDVAVPMEEALARIALDISGRPSLYMRCTGKPVPPTLLDRQGYNLSSAKQFLEAFVRSSGINLHIEYRGEDLHHVLEAIFKAFGRALCDATRIDPRVKGVPSTKGRL
ncbi:MAG TPA: imidazoleglycerol-phosphate dehydratase HisB [Candidatus Omnitrophota bacterium]|nr:imidazoleglycerol-phosphate dehydratase HisB [Candidatus Omnitrophota bacterium]HOX09747.1 imidazoleglycerol-phosphate dehydratase HisB [Candidatus Omnitrophota bacterium]HRZ66948.1 imidazoleglycerol-phosphate dehydratase HisB [Candidatus Omnitrophota bacterium]